MPTAIERIRNNPDGFCQTTAVQTGPAGGQFAGVQDGGRCEITSRDVNNRLVALEATANRGTDYFFPWLQRSFTRVRVPKPVSDGTIVMTGGLNGCTLVVSEDDGAFHFYHDGDSKYLKQGDISGNVVARIGPNDYDPNDELYTVFSGINASYAKAGLSPEGAFDYGLYVFFVRVNGEFHACKSGVITIGAATGYPGGVIARF